MEEINIDEINKVISDIDKGMSIITRKFSYLHLQEHTKDTILSTKQLLSAGQQLYKQLKAQLNILSEFTNECQNFIDEIEEDLSQKRKKENFVYKSTNGMLSYPGRSIIDKIKLQESQKEITDKTIVLGNIPLKLPVITNLQKIPPMFYYYIPTDNTSKEGIYCCLGSNIYLQVPFPIIIDSTKDINRDFSIKCKHKTRALCNEQREKMAAYHNSNIRKCSYAHEGEKLIKIGYSTRCTNVPNFGNLETINSDSKHVGLDGIKNILLYGLNDLIVSSLWFEKNKIKKIILNDLDIA